ncbi:hypothetical protein SCLCIDRAFT_527249 [Scleroderma citrinum Foug A]|uniref:DNA replication regulator SLD2 n=1 Tax=Scleroderma citrinum Foug A TaxID=1036808 RepID=A0A0C3A9G5_9AGAM|nr:hypothetical protein SCLCIDRAFT_527249 [Scleroderma citrinum Foug A]
MAEGELAAVRAQIKTWEREFRSAQGRDPSVQDIKEHLHIAEKYKLYKRITKATAASSSNAPPPQDPSSSLSSSRAPIIPKSRPVTAVDPLPGFNPFSPVKNKNRGKQKCQDPSTSSASHLSKAPSSINPFATPSKHKPNHRDPRTPSPDPFPLIAQANARDDLAVSDDPPVDRAVSRARKRLRGEPVSPSPNKQKRQRLGLSAVLPVSEVDESSDSEDRLDLAPGAMNASSIDDSPVKAPAGGKSFKLLFEDALPALSLPKNTTRSKNGKFDDIKSAIASSSSRQLAGTCVASSIPSRVGEASASPTNGTGHPIRSKAVSAGSGVPHRPAQAKSSVKRGLEDGELTGDKTHRGDAPISRDSLVPPSPPPGAVAPAALSKPKGGVQQRRKKPRIELEPSEDEGDSSDGIAVKVVAGMHHKPSNRDPDDLDWDPLLDLHAHSRDSSFKAEHDANRHESGTFSVDLPDNLRRVLAISPPGTQSSKEERVVRCLLYGDRVGHYDASRGGDIWDVGESNDGVRADTEAEDDWEGEPVPWEVGEL